MGRDAKLTLRPSPGGVHIWVWVLLRGELRGVTPGRYAVHIAETRYT